MLLLFMMLCTFALTAHVAGWLDDPDTQKSPAELQLDEGRGNYMGAGAASEPTGGGRAE